MAIKANRVATARMPSLNGHRRSCSLSRRRVSAGKGRLRDMLTLVRGVWRIQMRRRERMKSNIGRREDVLIRAVSVGLS